MKNIENLIAAMGHTNLSSTEPYLKSVLGGKGQKAIAPSPNSQRLPFKLEEFADYKLKRDLSTIVGVWTTYANIDWLASKSRYDVEMIRANGAEALQRLMPVALRDTNQSRHIAGFLLNLYNGKRFHFDLSDLGCIDHELFIDCITVLMLNVVPGSEIHTYFENGNKVFEMIAKDHGLVDYTKKP